MNIFTNDDYRRIQAWLKANAIKDSDFAISENTVPDEDILVITQNMSTVPTNYKIKIKDLLNSSLGKVVIDKIIANIVKVNNSLTVDSSKVILNNEKGTTLQDVFNYFEKGKLNRHTDDTFYGNLTIKKDLTIEGHIKSHDGTTTVEADLKATGEITDGHGNLLNDVNSAAKQWSLEYQDPQQDEPTVRAKYVLKDYRGVPKGSVIKIYKDSAITNVYLGTTEDTCDENTGEVTKKSVQDNNEALSIVYRLDTGKYSLVNIPIGIFTREAEFDKYRGLGVTENGQVFIKLANDVESSNYLHFNASGELSADGIENRILRDLGTIINSVASDSTMWGQYKKEEGTKDSQINEASRWGQYKQAEAKRSELLNTVSSKINTLENKIDSLALGAFYGYFPDSESLPIDITTSGYAYVGLDNPYEIWNFNGESWSGSGTSIDMNDADEEDITRNVDGKLQFKDRIYGNEMGYIILRKNKSFTEQVTKENTIYEIRYEFNLEGNSVTIPNNSILKFVGGYIKNGSVNLNNCVVEAEHICFFDVQIHGYTKDKLFKSKWFNFSEDKIKNSTILRNLITLTNVTIHFDAGTYSFYLNEDVVAKGCSLIGCYSGNNLTTIFDVFEENTECRFLLGLSYKSGIQNIRINVNSTNREFDVILCDYFFGCNKEAGASKREITIKNIFLNWNSYWNIQDRDNAKLYVNCIHFRHTDINRYTEDSSIGSDTGFSFRGNFEDIRIKYFHTGIKFTTGYVNTFMWTHSIYLHNLEIWAGRGISFEFDKDATVLYGVNRCVVTSYLYQRIADYNENNYINGYHRDGGFWGEVASLYFDRYDYWDTGGKGVLSGNVYQGTYMGANDTNSSTSGWTVPEGKTLNVNNWSIDSQNGHINFSNEDTYIDTDGSKKNYITSTIPISGGLNIIPTRKNNEAAVGKALRITDGIYHEYIGKTWWTNQLKHETIPTDGTTPIIQYKSDNLLFNLGGKIIPLGLVSSDANVKNYSFGIFRYGGRWGFIYDGKAQDINGGPLLNYVYSTKETLNEIVQADTGYNDVGRIVTVQTGSIFNHYIINREPGKNILKRLIVNTDKDHIGRQIPTVDGLVNSQGIYNDDIGFFYYSTEKKCPYWYNGKNFVQYDGSRSNAYRQGYNFIIDGIVENFLFFNKTYDKLYLATSVEDTETGQNITWKDVNGFTPAKKSGNNRPNLEATDVGYMFFDTTLNKPIWWTGTTWVDSTGIEV